VLVGKKQSNLEKAWKSGSTVRLAMGTEGDLSWLGELARGAIEGVGEVERGNKCLHSTSRYL